MIIIISDIHANFPALKTAIKTFGKYDKIISLGDIIGYGPNPIECIDWVKKNANISIMGNHDSALCNDSDLPYFNKYAKEVIYFCREIIPECQVNYICNLPMVSKLDDMFFVHANPSAPESWEYVIGKNQVYRILKEQDYKMLFIGHSHIPFIAELIDDNMKIYNDNASIKPEGKYLINVGSIGQPRDGDNRLAYAVLDRENNYVEIKRYMYDISETQRMMREMKLPEFLIERLEYGD